MYDVLRFRFSVNVTWKLLASTGIVPTWALCTVACALEMIDWDASADPRVHVMLTHAVAPAYVLYWPAPQTAQALAEGLLEYCPLLHEAHAEPLEPDWYVPAAHAEQLVAETPDWYAPAVHGGHSSTRITTTPEPP